MFQRDNFFVTSQRHMIVRYCLDSSNTTIYSVIASYDYIKEVMEFMMPVDVRLL